MQRRKGRKAGQKQDKSQKHCLAQGRRDAEKGKGKRKRHISRKDGKQNNKGQKQCLTQSPQRAQRNAKAKTLSHTELAGNAEKGKSKEISHAKPRRPQRGEGLTQRGEVNKGQKHDLTQRRGDAEKGKSSKDSAKGERVLATDARDGGSPGCRGNFLSK
jgi:hypothetical protein